MAKPIIFPPGKRAIFRPDYKSFGAFANSPHMRAVMVKVAGDIAAEAGRLAPRGKGSGPHLADNYKVDATGGGDPTRRIGLFTRVQVNVYNPLRHAAAQEFGWIDAEGAPGETGTVHDGSAPLRRAAAKLGEFYPGGPE